ncbi:MAG: DUF488 domain-containing protein [Hyphomicrobiales bacterium]|nr:DUF488 domain-containing protein [Hyphomicrobiales bacterium]
MPAPEMPNWPQGTIFTVGHSTLPLERFVGLLQAYGIERLADIRTIPRSRHNPQFNADTLPAALAGDGIEYRPMPELGGLRHAGKGSPNMGWRNASFRGYADYMQTPAFTDAVEALVKAGREKRMAIMCAEAVPWRCHRSLVADALLVRDVPVMEILSGTDWRPHKLTGFAALDGLTITYPPEQQSLL